MSFGKRKPKELNKRETLKQRFLSNKANNKVTNEKIGNENLTNNKRTGKRKLQKIKIPKGAVVEGNDNRCFLDIETTGFSRNYHKVIIIGLSCDGEFTQYVDTIDLLPNVIEKYIEENHIIEIVGFNSNRFDIDFLQKKFFLKEKTLVNIKQTDLMHQCHSLGIKGGLKKVEKYFNISREIEPIEFKDQTILWNRWISKGDEKALERLLIYNKDDVVNLEIIEKVLVESKKKQGDKNGYKKTKK